MNQLAESLSLLKFLGSHNDPSDPYHLTEHQVVGHQFSHGVSILCLTTQLYLARWRAPLTVAVRNRVILTLLSTGVARKLHSLGLV